MSWANTNLPEYMTDLLENPGRSMVNEVGGVQVGDSHEKVFFNPLTMSYPSRKPKRWDSTGAGYIFLSMAHDENCIRPLFPVGCFHRSELVIPAIFMRWF
jgi:hypothetical protein